MKNLLLTFLAIILAAGCAKKAVPSPETVIAPADTTIAVETILVPIEEPAIEISIPDPEVVEIAVEEIDEELPGIVEVSEPQTSIRKELDYDQLFPDSIWIEYMTRRGDYLSLIAYNE